MMISSNHATTIETNHSIGGISSLYEESDFCTTTDDSDIGCTTTDESDSGSVGSFTKSDNVARKEAPPTTSWASSNGSSNMKSRLAALYAQTVEDAAAPQTDEEDFATTDEDVPAPAAAPVSPLSPRRAKMQKSTLASFYAEAMLLGAEEEKKAGTTTDESTKSKSSGNKKRRSLKKKKKAAAGLQQSPAMLVRELFPNDMLLNVASDEEEDEEETDSDEEYDSDYDSDFEQDVASYNMEVVNAIRNKDVNQLRDLQAKGQSFDACNQNGEYLIHLACRRGDVATVQFLLDEADVNVNVVDQMGRTVLHDVCWRPIRCPELMALLLERVDPCFLLYEDSRGHTPFDYVRSEDWLSWKLFCHVQLLDIMLPRLSL